MMFPSVDQFLQELSLLKDEFLPESRLETVYSRLDKVSLRLVMSAALFVDIYFNAENGRLDFTLIHNNNKSLRILADVVSCPYENRMGSQQSAFKSSEA